ncbi:FtsK/SpoIIIE domain-containing protein [Crossiella sp. CA198]|uniref:FtsK/SpoIIIE domain-containing protein n=1 Tax=Crossiella sp. CA198 TaxID=3455607 RepID=UPI003F8D305F
MAETWPVVPVGQRLRVPVGSTVEGQPVAVDLKPRALGGIGAHGLITGLSEEARGEALRALLLGLVGTHSPDTLNLFLLDAGDGAVFTGFETVPQLAHLLTGPDAAAHVLTALRAESTRRAELLRQRTMRTQHDYERARHYDPALDPMTTLVVVVNRLLKLDRLAPRLIELIKDEAPGWQDRGVHLVATADQVTDLPSGLAKYFGFELNIRDSDLVLWPSGQDPVVCQPLPPVEVAEGLAGLPFGGAIPEPLLLPPLAERMALDALLPPLATSEELGLHCPGEPRLAPVVGLVDRRGERRRAPFRLDLSTGDGHALVVGDPSAGVEEVLHNAALGLALANTPAHLQLYVLDFAGESLLGLRELPHTRVAAGYQDFSLLWHTATDLAALVDRRELARRNGTAEREPAAVVVIVHGWYGLRRTTNAHDAVWDLICRGPGVNVHVLLGIHRWAELDGALADAFSTRLELRLSAPHYSAVDPVLAKRISGRGHGLTGQAEPFLAALPVFQDDAQPVAAIDKVWTGDRPKQLRPLPRMLPIGEVPADERWPLGVLEGELQGFGFGAKQHLLCFGDYESGRTNVLRALLHHLTASLTPDKALVAGIDPRRNWLGAVEGDSLLTYLTQTGKMAVPIGEIRDSLVKRRDEGRGTGPDLYLVIDDYEIIQRAEVLDVLADLVPHAGNIGLHLIIAGRYLSRTDPLLNAVNYGETMVLLLNGDPATPDVITGLNPYTLPPGCAQLYRDNRPTQLVQVGWVPEQ